MKKFEAWEKVNDSEWEQDACTEPIEAENEQEALEMYIDLVADDLRAFDAVRVDDDYPYSATFKYWNDSESEVSTIELKMKEVEEN